MGVKFQRLLVVLNGEGLVAIIHISFSEAVPCVVRLRIDLDGELEYGNGVRDFLRVQQVVAEGDQFVLAEIVGFGLSCSQVSLLADGSGHVTLLEPIFTQGTKQGADRLRCDYRTTPPRSFVSGQRLVASPTGISLSCCPTRLTSKAF